MSKIRSYKHDGRPVCGKLTHVIDRPHQPGGKCNVCTMPPKHRGKCGKDDASIDVPLRTTIFTRLGGCGTLTTPETGEPGWCNNCRSRFDAADFTETD